MISKIKNEMIRQFVIQFAFFKVFSAVRIDDSLIVNVMFIFRNVYNLQTQIRRDELDFLIFIQALIRKFDESD